MKLLRTGLSNPVTVPRPAASAPPVSDSSWAPEDFGWLGWTIDPWYPVATNARPSPGFVYNTPLKALPGATINTVVTFAGGATLSGVTADENFFAIFSEESWGWDLVAQTAAGAADALTYGLNYIPIPPVTFDSGSYIISCLFNGTGADGTPQLIWPQTNTWWGPGLVDSFTPVTIWGAAVTTTTTSGHTSMPTSQLWVTLEPFNGGPWSAVSFIP